MNRTFATGVATPEWCALFDAVMKGSHTRVVRVELLESNRVIAATQGDALTDGTLPGSTISGLPISEGSYQQDRSSFARRTLSCVITDEALADLGGRSALAPYGRELRPWLGALMPDNSVELVCLGTFVIRDGARSYPFTGLTVTGVDRCYLVSADSMLFPLPLPAGPARVNLAQLLSSSGHSDVLFAPGVGDAQVPALTPEGDRATPVTDLLTSLASELTTTPLGDFLVVTVPDAAGPADFMLDAADALLTDAQTQSRDGVFNATRASGQQTGDDVTPTSPLIVDTDPLSPTWYDGPFGHVSDPNPISLPTITTNAQATLAAQARLRNRLGLAKSIDWTSLVNPCYEAGDVGAFTHADGSVTQHVVDSLTIPLGPGAAMSGQSRALLVKAAA